MHGLDNVKITVEISLCNTRGERQAKMERCIQMAHTARMGGTYCNGAHIRDAQIPDTGSPWRLHFVQWRLISVAPQYETCFTPHFWRVEF